MAYKEQYPSKLLEEAVDAIGSLPGVGRRSALRLALHLLKQPQENVHHFAQAVVALRDDVKYCRECRMISDDELCSICGDHSRDHNIICVVESVRDVMSIENTGQYRGMYHVLGGVISPMQGIGPSDLKIDLLADKLLTGTVKEVIIAISASVEGETTMFYLMNCLKRFPHLKVTTIARGIGFGDELEYVDELTITQALINRREITKL